MRLLDYVIWLNEDATCGLGVRDVRDDEFWVQGHVPGRPLLPGVLMIEAAAQLCSFLQGVRPRVEPSQFMGFIRCDDVIFRGQVVPGDRLYLMAKEISCRARGDEKCLFVMAHPSKINERVVEAKERYSIE